jgi:hypothetical protein
VKGSSRAALNRINDKMLAEITGKNLIARLYNRLGFLWIQQADLTVCYSRSFFDLDEAVDKLRMQVEAGDPKVLHRPQRLHSVIGIHRNFLITNGVVFDTELFLPGFSLFRNSAYSRRPADSAPQHFSDHELNPPFETPENLMPHFYCTMQTAVKTDLPCPGKLRNIKIIVLLRAARTGCKTEKVNIHL